MCIAIVKPQGTTITDEELKNCFEANPHGSGVAYVEKSTGKLTVVKGIFKVDAFINAVRLAELDSIGAILIHSRIATSGLHDVQNCHPHVVNNKVVMIHNGVLNIHVPKDSKVSDTVIYVQEFLKDLPEDFIYNKAILRLIEDSIGSHNKFCFLNNKGDYAIANEKSGHWNKGIWFSNDSYKSYQRMFFGKGCYSNSYGYWDDWDDSDDTYERYMTDDIQTISNKKIKKLKKYIRRIDDKKMLELGQYPLYDTVENKIIPYQDFYNRKRYKELDEVSSELFEEYQYEYDSRGFEYVASGEYL